MTGSKIIFLNQNLVKTIKGHYIFLFESTLEMVEKLKPAIALLDKHQKPYDVVYTYFVGTIVYEDDWQIAVQVENGKMI